MKCQAGLSWSTSHCPVIIFKNMVGLTRCLPVLLDGLPRDLLVGLASGLHARCRGVVGELASRDQSRTAY